MILTQNTPTGEGCFYPKMPAISPVTRQKLQQAIPIRHWDWLGVEGWGAKLEDPEFVGDLIYLAQFTERLYLSLPDVEKSWTFTLTSVEPILVYPRQQFLELLHQFRPFRCHTVRSLHERILNRLAERELEAQMRRKNYAV